MAFFHDVMLEVFAVTCVSCPFFRRRRGRHLSLGSLVPTSQVAMKVGSHEGSVAQFSVYYVATEQATMAGAMAGRLEPFNSEVKSTVVYLERVELYFAANEIKADKRVPVFLNLIGRENYSLLQSILSPQKPVEQPQKKLMDVLREYYEPKKVVMAARFLFHQRQQQPGESVAISLAELRKLAVPCEFGETLDEALRDRLVCGLGDEAYQKRLLSEPELTIDKALQIAQSMETADVNSCALRGSESGIHQMSKGGARLSPSGK